MTGADKVVCQAATLLLLFTLTSQPARAQFAGLGGGGGGTDMMTQMAPMLEMMKAKMGKRRFAMMMQTMGPMMSKMMDGSGGGFGQMGGGFPGMGGGMPAGMGNGIPGGMIPGGMPGGLEGMIGGGRIPGGFSRRRDARGRADGHARDGRRRHHGDARRRRWRRIDGHDSAIDADGQFRRRPPASPAAVVSCPSLRAPRSNPEPQAKTGLLRCARNDG